MYSTILLIEDDQDVRNVVKGALEDAGFTALTASNGTDGLKAVRETNPDLVLLDLGLPDMDGARVASRLRSACSTPVIILTARDDMDCRVRLLEQGASDYITKPFLPEELLARVHVQFRRAQGQEETLCVGPLEVRVGARQAFYRGREVMLSPGEFNLLAFLAHNPNRVFSRDEIQDVLLEADERTTGDVVDVHASNVRAKLHAMGGYGLLRSVRGFGYVIRDAPGQRAKA